MKMNKFFFAALIAVSVLFASCGNASKSDSGSNIPKEIDYQMLGNEADLAKVYDVAVKKMGENIKYVEKLSLSISRPKERGNNGDDDLQIILQQIHPGNKNKLIEYTFWSSQGKWENGQTLEVDLIGGDAESFSLEDNLMDLSGLTVERIYKAVQEALQKYKSDKYGYQYISSINIENDMITIFIHGKLAANELLKFETYKVKL